MNNKTSNYLFNDFQYKDALLILSNELPASEEESKEIVSLKDTAINGLVFEKEDKAISIHDLEGNKIPLGIQGEEVEIKEEETIPLFTITDNSNGDDPDVDSDSEIILTLNDLQGESLNKATAMLESFIAGVDATTTPVGVFSISSEYTFTCSMQVGKAPEDQGGAIVVMINGNSHEAPYNGGMWAFTTKTTKGVMDAGYWYYGQQLSEMEKLADLRPNSNGSYPTGMYSVGTMV